MQVNYLFDKAENLRAIALVCDTLCVSPADRLAPTPLALPFGRRRGFAHRTIGTFSAFSTAFSNFISVV
ncbi:MAG: hypothetical protein KME30_00420 [Iphinoe sp. HA4291-MV1]|nr:hypothetical protein [Iphinoe sp. HA4291-MV1]